LPPVPDTSDERLEAAELLEQATLDVIGEATSPHFQLQVGLNGAIAGTLHCAVSMARDSVRLRFGIVGAPSDQDTTRRIRDALDINDDLLSVFYQSGHSIQAGGIYGEQIRDVPFPRWRFEDFAGFVVTREKPAVEHSQVHQLVGEPADDSLFGWVVHNYGDGWLTCDDGAEEIADFVHLLPGVKLSLIHVKAAKSDSVQRQVSASAYEVVAGQATKNIGFLRTDVLAARLATPAAASRATWLDGVRQPNRAGMAAAVAAEGRVELEIVIVQPHVRKDRRDGLRSGVIADGADLLRLNRLETLLNAGRGAVTGVGAELVVVASS
jgi:hypothetical protein